MFCFFYRTIYTIVKGTTTVKLGSSKRTIRKVLNSYLMDVARSNEGKINSYIISINELLLNRGLMHGILVVSSQMLPICLIH